MTTDSLSEIQNMSATTYSGHELGPGKVVLSFHQRWMMSVASDGKLMLRLAGNPVSLSMNISNRAHRKLGF